MGRSLQWSPIYLKVKIVVNDETQLKSRIQHVNLLGEYNQHRLMLKLEFVVFNSLITGYIQLLDVINVA